MLASRYQFSMIAGSESGRRSKLKQPLCGRGVVKRNFPHKFRLVFVVVALRPILMAFDTLEGVVIFDNLVLPPGDST